MSAFTLPTFLEPLEAYIQQLIAEAIRPLQDEIALLKSQQSEWVDTKEALRLTGIKQAETLKAERERPHTLLIFKFEGDSRKMPRYLRSSLLAYNEAKTERRLPGRNLAA